MPGESNTTGWMKVIVPVLLTFLLTAGLTYWGSTTLLQKDVAALEATVESQKPIIDGFSQDLKSVQREVSDMKAILTGLEAEKDSLSKNQDKVLGVVEKLSDTIIKLEVSLGKVETRLETER